MHASTVERALSDFVERVSACCGARLRSIRLFGSWARGTARPDSDVDVLVVVDQRDPVLYSAIQDAAQEVDLEHLTALSVKVCSQAHVEEMRRLHDPFWSDVEREGRCLWTPTSRAASETA